MTDWAVLELPGIDEVALRAARQVAREYQGVVEADDLHQEARIALAANGSIIREYLAEGLPTHVYRMVWSDLVDIARREAGKKNRLVPLDA